jgi:hypothetical protein
MGWNTTSLRVGMDWENNMYVYVYYKFVPSTNKVIAQLKNDVAALQLDVLEAFPGVQGQLFKRPKLDQEGRETWMEVYNLEALNIEDPQPFIDYLIQLAQQKLLPQPRANEIFVAINTKPEQLIDY